MALTASLASTAADAMTSRASLVSLHTADPGPDGAAAEVSGGGYERQSATWGPAANGVAWVDGAIQFAGPLDLQVTHVGLWAADGVEFLGSLPAPAPASFGTAGLSIPNLALAALR